MMLIIVVLLLESLRVKPLKLLKLLWNANLSEKKGLS